MPEDTAPDPAPESAYPPPSSPYPSPAASGGPSHASRAEPPAALNPQTNWPPPPIGSYAPIAAPQYSPVNGTMILILGILGLTICGLCAPIAWVLGNQAMATLNQYGDPLSQRGLVNGGRICGIIGTALIGIGLVFYIILFAFGMAGALTHPSTR